MGQDPFGDGQVELAPPDADEFVPLPLQRGLADVVVPIRGADPELRDGVGVYGNLVVFRVLAQLVAVQRKPRLHAQRIAGAQARRDGAEADQGLPERHRLPGFDEQLETDRLAGISGPGNHHLAPVEIGGAQSVPLVFRKRPLVDHLLQHRRGFRALNGDHCEAFADVRHRRVAAAKVALQPLPVGVAVAGVDHQKEVVRRQLVKVGVVDRAAAVIGDEGVLRLARLQRPCIVGQHAQQERLGARPLDAESAHVGDVEQAGAPPGGEVFLDDPGGVVDRHVPAAECDHPGAVRDMPAVQDGLAVLAGSFTRHDEVTRFGL